MMAQLPLQASLFISPALYRRHLNDPDVLPTLLGRATQVLTDEMTVWTIHEGTGPFLVSDADFDLTHPGQAPLGSPLDWQLTGVALMALLALRLIAERAERVQETRNDS